MVGGVETLVATFAPPIAAMDLYVSENGKRSYVHRGKKVCRFVRADCLKQLNARLQAYKTFRELSDRWIELSIKCAQAEFFPQAKRT